VVVQGQNRIADALANMRRRKQLMGWTLFIFAVARLIFLIWAPKRSGRLAQVKTVVNSLLLSKPPKKQEQAE
jgi:hypothetical protein